MRCFRAPLFLDQVDMRNIMLVDSLIEGRIVTFVAAAVAYIRWERRRQYTAAVKEAAYVARYRNN